ncbi:MAG: SDR family oxidoreductase [Sulfurovum sp.]|nr:SDR family oxidoreductase [Sulfurovum sp.]
MISANTTIAIVGVTGLLGRNILFEYLKQYKYILSNLNLILFGRDYKSKYLRDRIKDIFLDDGRYYLDLNDDELGLFLNFIDKNITYIHLDFEQYNLGLVVKDIERLKLQNIDIFYHLGAYTSFSSSNSTKEKVDNINTVGTEKLLNIFKKLKINRFCYFSSAFATGLLKEKVLPDDLDLDREYRNPYEESKLKAEIIVRKFEKESGVSSYIFRPSILAGRLVEKNLGQIHKFDVFYGWTQFFLKTKQSLLPYGFDIYQTPLNIDLRIFANEKSTLNIIPADFAAKATIKIMSKKYIEYSSFHLTNNNESEFIIPIMNFLNITGYTFVEEIPEDLNKVENLYYRSVGRLFNDYMQNHGEIYFDNSSLIQSLSNDIICPQVNNEELLVLLEYAKEKNFGI